MAALLTVDEFLDGHVALDVECLDRVDPNGYMPNRQVGGQVASFMTQHGSARLRSAEAPILNRPALPTQLRQAWSTSHHGDGIARAAACR
jgi:hypothetical protein